MSNDVEALYKKWELYCEASHKEKDWMKDRLSWVFTPQGVIFAVYTLSLQDKFSEKFIHDIENIQFYSSLLGLIISFVVFIGLVSAARMYFKWNSEVIRLAKELDAHRHPVTFGSKPYWPSYFANFVPLLIAATFLTIWIIIFINILFS